MGKPLPSLMIPTLTNSIYDRSYGTKHRVRNNYICLKRYPKRGLPLIMYSSRRRGVGQVSYTFVLRITCKKKGEGRGSRKHVKLRVYLMEGP